MNFWQWSVSYCMSKITGLISHITFWCSFAFVELHIHHSEHRFDFVVCNRICAVQCEYSALKFCLLNIVCMAGSACESLFGAVDQHGLSWAGAETSNSVSYRENPCPGELNRSCYRLFPFVCSLLYCIYLGRHVQAGVNDVKLMTEPIQLKGSVKEQNKFHNYETEKITRKASDVAKYIELFGFSTEDRHARCI